MGTLMPLVFAVLSAVVPADTEQCIEVGISTPGEVDMVVGVDTIASNDGPSIIIGDVITTVGSSRRILSSEIENQVTDVLDGGSWGEEGFVESLYFTDSRNETITAWFSVADANPVISPAPEGGLLVEFTDRIVLTLINHDTSEQESITLRDNQIIYKLNTEGLFGLQSIRPKPTDSGLLSSSLRVYNLENGDAENPLSRDEFSKFINSYFPIPGRVFKQ